VTSSISLIAHGKVKTIKVHHLVPAMTKSSTNFFSPSELALTSAGARSLEFEPKTRSTREAVHLRSPRPAIAAFKEISVFCDRFPLCAHVEQVHEEIISQLVRSVGEIVTMFSPQCVPMIVLQISRRIGPFLTK
jgi:hypothetical protein